MKSSDVCKDYIGSLRITLVALGYAGNSIVQQNSDTWENHLKKLSDIDWHKANPEWENLVFVNGRVAANRSTQKTMSNYMQEVLSETAGNNNG